MSNDIVKYKFVKSQPLLSSSFPAGWLLLRMAAGGLAYGGEDKQESVLLSDITYYQTYFGTSSLCLSSNGIFSI